MSSISGILSSRRTAFVAGTAVLISLSVVLTLSNPPNANKLLFLGGWHAGAFGAAMLLLIPLVISIQFALGASFARFFEKRQITAEPWMLWLTGSAMLSVGGVAVAALNAINPWVCGGSLVLGVAFAFGPAHEPMMRALGELFSWLRLKDVTAEKSAFAIVRLGIILALVLVGLRAATGELNDTDVVQFYWSWLNEVRHIGGIWLTPERPLIQDFVVGRGNGTYLLLSGLAPGLVVHVVSATYCILIAMILRAFVLKATDTPRNGSEFSLFAADLACLASLWMLPGAVSFGKYHLQFAAWALGLLLGALIVAVDDRHTRRTYRILLIPLAIAIPVGLAQFEVFALLIVGLAIAASKKLDRAWILMPVVVAGISSAGLSIAFNWIYLGIPDYNPFYVFEHFIWDARFEIWTSRLQQYYLNYIQAGVFNLSTDDGVSAVRQFRSLISGILKNLPLFLMAAVGMVIVAVLSWPRWLSGRWEKSIALLLGIVLGWALYRLSMMFSMSDLATKPILNSIAISGVFVAGYLFIVTWCGAPTAPFAFVLLGYWLMCQAFILVFHSGSLDRLMRHADVVAVSMLVVAVVLVKKRNPHISSRSAPILSLLVACIFFVSCRAGFIAATVDPPLHLLRSVLGLSGRAVGLTNPMAKFERCKEIAAEVPADSRVIFLNAYTAMAYCNNGVLLPRGMVVHQYQSDYAREIADAAFADADQVERTLRRLRIDYFLVLKDDTEFWSSGLSAPFRPDELGRRFSLVIETPSFYILTWHGMGKPIPAEVFAKITEWRRVAIEQHGFIWSNEFVGQWRAMANLGADRPKYVFGTPIDFTSQGWSALYADHGWYAAEPAGSWTIGPLAVLTIPFERPAVGALSVSLEFRPFLPPQIPIREVHVSIDGYKIADWVLTLGEAMQTKTILVPAEIVANKSQVVMTLMIDKSLSPYVLMINEDWRQIGIMVRSLRVSEIPAL